MLTKGTFSIFFEIISKYTYVFVAVIYFLNQIKKNRLIAIMITIALMYLFFSVKYVKYIFAVIAYIIQKILSVIKIMN